MNRLANSFIPVLNPVTFLEDIRMTVVFQCFPELENLFRKLIVDFYFHVKLAISGKANDPLPS
jgi:hypothetical protein